MQWIDTTTIIIKPTNLSVITMKTQKHFDLISEQLFNDRKPLTYKYLSRLLDISNNNSRQLLQDYYDAFKPEKSELSSRFVITGKSENQNLVKITFDTDLESSKQMFESIHSCAIYSLNYNDQLSFGNIVAINQTVNKPYTSENCNKWGVIECPNSEEPASKPITQIPETKPSAPLETKPEIPEAIKQPTKVAKEEEPTKSLYVSRKSQPKQEKINPIQSMFNSTTTDPKPTTAKESNKRPQYTSRKKDVKSTVVMDHIQSEDNADEEELENFVQQPASKKIKIETTEEKAKRLKREQELAKMFEDDDNFDESAPSTQAILEDKESIDADPVEGAEEGDLKEQQTEPTPAPELAPETTKKTVTDDIKQDSIDTSTNSTAVTQDEDAGPVYDEEGYLIVRNKSLPPPKPTTRRSNTVPQTKKHTIELPVIHNKKDTGKGGSKKQASLMTFFSKKK